MPINNRISSSPDLGSSPKHVVVVGSGGRLGNSLVRFLEQDYLVSGFDHKQLDLGSLRSIDEALGGLDYDQLFLAGALTGVDYCEDHVVEAFSVNSVGPGRVAEISREKGAHVTYISTDMVFDGSKAEPYLESDTPNPINVYGASKLEGEARILDASPENLVARISWLYGPGRPAFPEWIIDKACSDENLTLPGDKICCPTYTLDLIEWLAALVLARAGGPSQGIFHLCNSNPCSWREWGQFCIDAAREAGFPIVAGKIRSVPVDSVAAFVAKRPINSAMSTEKFSALTGIRPRDWTDALHDFVFQSDSFNKYRSESPTS